MVNLKKFRKIAKINCPLEKRGYNGSVRKGQSTVLLNLIECLAGQPSRSRGLFARPKSGSNAIKTRTVEVRELDICECCEFKDLEVYEETKYYADGHVFVVPDAYLKCSNYPLCKRAVRLIRNNVNE